jgi:hypothetical protein
MLTRLLVAAALALGGDAHAWIWEPGLPDGSCLGIPLVATDSNNDVILSGSLRADCTLDASSAWVAKVRGGTGVEAWRLTDRFPGACRTGPFVLDVASDDSIVRVDRRWTCGDDALDSHVVRIAPSGGPPIWRQPLAPLAGTPALGSTWRTTS